uniref:Putative secreted peptide n=1 Tax=Anopheles braziliensis TaxID=58242 RepID=A0A2M3ZUE1_9DIPT
MLWFVGDAAGLLLPAQLALFIVVAPVGPLFASTAAVASTEVGCFVSAPNRMLLQFISAAKGSWPSRPRFSGGLRLRLGGL